jgi:hypothetical protein
MKLKTEIKVRKAAISRQSVQAFDNRPVHYKRPLWGFSTVSLGVAPRTAFHLSFAALGASTGQRGQKLRNMRQHQIAAAETFQMIEIRQRDKCHLGDMLAALLDGLVGPVLCARNEQTGLCHGG